MKQRISDWTGAAFNQVPDSDNRIHSDELALAYGFKGALVPGVTVSAYLMHPAVCAWGLDWLERGTAQVRVLSPLYDEQDFAVKTNPTGEDYSAELHSEGRLCATASVSLPREFAAAPVYRADPIMSEDYQAPAASREHMEKLRESGCPAKGFLWSAEQAMATYLREQQGMPALLRTDRARESAGYANPAFLLGCANRHFAAVASMSPWIHLQTSSRNYQALPLNCELVSEMRIIDLFERKGHEFADCEFILYRRDDASCICRIEQRAIYRMRPL